MTTKEINVAIAEACGLSVYETSNQYGTKDIMVWDGKDNSACRELPDYYGDLNAMHEAEKAKGFHRVSLAPVVSRYHQILLEVVAASGVEKTWCATICATAPQRAQAFLRTTGRWVNT